MVNFMAWVLVGGLLGCGTSRLVRGDTAAGLALNVAAGVVGAYLSGLIITPLFTLGALYENSFSPLSVGIAVAGAGMLLAVVNLPRRNRGGS
jgi:uncharacterized membrane protein YeaQ/YmgE (transglycosylase-associated protein family)